MQEFGSANKDSNTGKGEEFFVLEHALHLSIPVPTPFRFSWMSWTGNKHSNQDGVGMVSMSF